jgi:hypothetical protein
MITNEIETIPVTCACCAEIFWDWAWGINTICDMCENYEPPDFDDWE